MKKPQKVKEEVKESPPVRVCASCLHYFGLECRRMSPVPMGRPDAYGAIIYLGVWPIIRDTATCSQWTPRECP